MHVCETVQMIIVMIIYRSMYDSSDSIKYNTQPDHRNKCLLVSRDDFHVCSCFLRCCFCFCCSHSKTKRATKTTHNNVAAFRADSRLSTRQQQQQQPQTTDDAKNAKNLRHTYCSLSHRRIAARLHPTRHTPTRCRRGREIQSLCPTERRAASTVQQNETRKITEPPPNESGERDSRLPLETPVLSRTIVAL